MGMFLCKGNYKILDMHYITHVWILQFSIFTDHYYGYINYTDSNGMKIYWKEIELLFTNQRET